MDIVRLTASVIPLPEKINDTSKPTREKVFISSLYRGLSILLLFYLGNSDRRDHGCETARPTSKKANKSVAILLAETVF